MPFRAGVDAPSSVYKSELAVTRVTVLHVISRLNFLPTEAQVEAEEAMSLSSLDQSVYGVLYLSSLMLTGFYGITCMQT